jgi:putative ABC transport system permease protein
MAVPLIYNLRSIRVRWASTSVAVLGIGGAVAVFVAVLSLARGFEMTLVESGSPRNALIRRAGSSSEMESVVYLDQAKVVADAPQVVRDREGRPLVSGEVVAIGAFRHRASRSDALAQVRGVSEVAISVRDNLRISSGRFLTPGLSELVVGKNAERMYEGFSLGATPRFGGRTWTVVGILDAGGSAFDSEVWADARVLNQTFKRPENLFQSVTVRLGDPGQLAAFEKALKADPRLTVQVDREDLYYAKQSRAVSTMIKVLGYLVAVVMGVGALFAALNTLYSALAARVREVATLRAIGFSPASVVVSWLFEALAIALLGGLLGDLLVLPLNGVTTSTINWQTFSQLAFAFRVTPGLLLQGLAFALLMGLLGGLPPALRAARIPVATALREL